MDSRETSELPNSLIASVLQILASAEQVRMPRKLVLRTHCDKGETKKH